MKVLDSEKQRVLKSTDYSLFKVPEILRFSNNKLNQIISELAIKNLSKDLPIIVDENFNILDGRYRFLANKHLGQPIYYKVAEISTMVDLMKAKSTTFKPTFYDYLLVHQDKVSYRKLLEYLKQLPFPLKHILDAIFDVEQSFISHKSNNGKKFKDGTFDLRTEHEFKIKKSIEFIVELNKRTEFSEIDNFEFITQTLDNYDFSVNKALDEIFNCKYLDKWFEFKKENHPMASTIDDFIFEANMYKKEGSINEINDNPFYVNIPIKTYWVYPILRAMNNYYNLNLV
jgi:hypothetical protein